MSQYKSSSELKDLAKSKLNRNYGVAIMAILTVGCTQFLVSYFISTLIPAATLGQFITRILINCALSIFLGIFQTGLSLFFLNMACGQPYRLDQVFYGFQNNPNSSLVVSLANGVLSLIQTAPLQIFLRLYYDTKNPEYLKWALIGSCIGFLIYYPLSLIISQSYYLLLDFPDYSGKDALLASCKIMKKHLWRLLYIQLSFIPLIILCVLSSYIGFLWLIPYMNMTYALFFLDIMKVRTATDN